jgi:hypothetical protein
LHHALKEVAIIMPKHVVHFNWRNTQGRSRAWCCQCYSTGPSALHIRETMRHLTHKKEDHTNLAPHIPSQRHSVIISDSAPGNTSICRMLQFVITVTSLCISGHNHILGGQRLPSANEWVNHVMQPSGTSHDIFSRKCKTCILIYEDQNSYLEC